MVIYLLLFCSSVNAHLNIKQTSSLIWDVNLKIYVEIEAQSWLSYFLKKMSQINTTIDLNENVYLESLLPWKFSLKRHERRPRPSVHLRLNWYLNIRRIFISCVNFVNIIKFINIVKFVNIHVVTFLKVIFVSIVSIVKYINY